MTGPLNQRQCAARLLRNVLAFRNRVGKVRIFRAHNHQGRRLDTLQTLLGRFAEFGVAFPQMRLPRVPFFDNLKCLWYNLYTEGCARPMNGHANAD